MSLRTPIRIGVCNDETSFVLYLESGRRPQNGQFHIAQILRLGRLDLENGCFWA